MTPKHSRSMYRKQRTLIKHDILPFLSSVLTEVIFNVRVRTANFEMTYIRLGLCTCVRSFHKFCSPSTMILKQDIQTIS